jgi:hypothetical protein
VPPPSHLTSSISLNLTHILSFFATVMSEPALYRLHTFHVPNLISIFFSSDRLPNDSVQVRGRLCHFVTKLFFTVSCNPHAQTQAVEPPIVGYLRLSIPHICRCLPHLEVVSFRNLRTRHVVPTRDPSNMALNIY